MRASSDQMAIIVAGTSAAPNKRWEPVAVPTDAEVPPWCLGLEIDWMWEYGNRPHVNMYTDGTEYDGEWLFEFEKLGKEIYSSERDGRLRWHSHGAYSRQTLKRWDVATQKHVEYEAFATALSQGYGGREFPIKMVDGTDVILRGPWHIGAPPGFVEVSNYDLSKVKEFDLKWAAKTRRNWLAPGGAIYKLKKEIAKLEADPETKPYWLKRRRDTLKAWDDRINRPLKYQAVSGTFGMAIRNELFLAMLAKYQPHLRAALVHQYGNTFRLEPRFAGQAPKDMVIEDQDISGD